MKKPPFPYIPPLMRGLSWRRDVLKAGTSEAELRGIGFGDKFGGRDVRYDEGLGASGGSGNSCSEEGG